MALLESWIRLADYILVEHYSRRVVGRLLRLTARPESSLLPSCTMALDVLHTV
jgi:hypothetical protein